MDMCGYVCCTVVMVTLLLNVGNMENSFKSDFSISICQPICLDSGGCQFQSWQQGFFVYFYH
jgi:hypothetical protein